ncbi:hypothetical protein DQ04_05951030 [Trypanosoma grayi]|uniref:hypothetical protein n=1 Tax=Trypanosoma grayi TaxID=71804 RepID=UPI0004F3F5BF|nr:hypothetical protein DQ04_05951030 [Trypanosoma grayi]KEG09033.1 hypothetical protein DQ04_05951030 [Trypanosoma grayi]
MLPERGVVGLARWGRPSPVFRKRGLEAECAAGKAEGPGTIGAGHAAPPWRQICARTGNLRTALPKRVRCARAPLSRDKGAAGLRRAPRPTFASEPPPALIGFVRIGCSALACYGAARENVSFFFYDWFGGKGPRAFPSLLETRCRAPVPSELFVFPNCFLIFVFGFGRPRFLLAKPRPTFQVSGSVSVWGRLGASRPSHIWKPQGAKFRTTKRPHRSSGGVVGEALVVSGPRRAYKKKKKEPMRFSGCKKKANTFQQNTS